MKYGFQDMHFSGIYSCISVDFSQCISHICDPAQIGLFIFLSVRHIQMLWC